MRAWNRLFLAITLAGSFTAVAPAQTTADQKQPQANRSGTPITTVAQAIDRIIARERDENALMRRYSPIVETYVQDMKVDPDMGLVPFHDGYYL